MAREILTGNGYKVICSLYAEEALSLAADHPEPINLLLTDVVMPEIDGKMLFDQISTLVPGIKVLYMSGYTNDVIAHRGVLYEGINFIQKPFSIIGLAAKVRTVLDEK